MLAGVTPPADELGGAQRGPAASTSVAASAGAANINGMWPDL